MERVRVASIGLGWWGGMLAGKAQESGLEIVSAFARSQEHRDQFVTDHGGTAVDSLEDLLADSELEGVLIATSHSSHADLVVQSAAAGKHVFVEKPLTLTIAEAKRAIRAAEEAGVVLQVGHNRRRQPANRRLKEMVDSGGLGTIQYAEANLSNPRGLNPRTGWRGDPAESPAGGMTGLGVHMADNLTYLLGPASRVAAFSKKVLEIGTLDNATTATLEFHSGPLAFLGTSTVIPDIARTAVWGTEAAAWNELDGERFYVQNTGDKDRTEEPVETLDTVKDELEEFARNIRTGTRPETGGPEALEAVAILEGIVESATTGRIVDLDEVRAR